MKRCKTTSTNSKNGCIVLDRISSLKEELLSRILSLLSTKEAVCTSILSRRWRSVYGWLTKLEFDYSPFSRLSDCSERISHFITHVDTVLRVCHSKNMTRFSLKESEALFSPYCFDLESAHVDRWISFPLSRTVTEIDVCVHVKQPGKLPPQLFSLDMVEVLKIDSNLEVENPRSFALVSLKVLHLKNLVIPDSDFLAGLLPGCPSLLELYVERCNCGKPPEVNISHPFLERLSLDIQLKDDEYQRNDVVLDTPNLRYLKYVDILALRYSAGNLNALVEADISIGGNAEYEETYFPSMLSLLSLLAKIRSLSLSDWSYMDCDAFQFKEKLVLLNLKDLTLYIHDFIYCFVLLDLLHCSSLLERLTLLTGSEIDEFEECFDGSVYARLTTELESTAQSIPSCVRSHLKKIEYDMFKASEKNFSLLKYLLRNAAVLLELDVACYSAVDLIQIEIALKSLPRASADCLIKEQPLTKLNEGDHLSLIAESSVTCTYQTFLIAAQRNVVVTWSKVSETHSLTITIENLYDEDHQTCQIDFQSSQFWSRKGLKSLQVDDGRVDIFWDLRDVKFSSNPEPCSNYYVAIVFEKQMVLLLGDLRAEALKRSMSRSSQVSPILIHKEEILYGNNSFQTQVLLDDGPKEHAVVIENPLLRHGEPELRISIDGRVVVRVMNLNWRFRGNETALINNVPIQIFWDVHDWLFNPQGSAHGLFIFKPGSLGTVSDEDDEGNEGVDEQSPVVAGCCHFVFAVKVN